MKLREWRVKLGISQAELSRQAHVNRSVINQLEMGTRGMSLAAMHAICVVLGVEYVDVEEFKVLAEKALTPNPKTLAA